MAENNNIDTETGTASFKVDLPSESELQRLVICESWQNLGPRFNRPDALLPSEISFSQMQQIIAALTDAKVIEAFVPPGEMDARVPFQQVDLSGTGQLRALGQGERKCGFVFTTGSGKKIAVILQAGYNGPLQIPQDPRISINFVEQFRNRKLYHYSYSDLHTYLTVPFSFRGKSFGIRFQEFGGDEHLNSWSTVTMEVIKKLAEKYIDSKGYKAVEPSDFNKAEHYLLPNGKLSWPALIDVSLVSKRDIN